VNVVIAEEFFSFRATETRATAMTVLAKTAQERSAADPDPGWAKNQDPDPG
jgi:hypothetical protein